MLLAREWLERDERYHGATLRSVQEALDVKTNPKLKPGVAPTWGELIERYWLPVALCAGFWLSLLAAILWVF